MSTAAGGEVVAECDAAGRVPACFAQAGKGDAPRARARTLVLGLGNPILGDDGVGLAVAQVLCARLAGVPAVEVDTEPRGGLRVVERMAGYERVVLIDALCSGRVPGSVLRLTLGAIPTQHNASGHDVNLATALALVRASGLAVPRVEDIHIVAIEVEQVDTFGTTLTQHVADAVERAARLVERILAEQGVMA